MSAEEIFERKSNIEVLTATVGDLTGILSVQKENLLDQKSEEGANPSLDGFLVHETDPEILRKVIEDSVNHIIFVAYENGEMVGYVMAYDLQTWKQDHPEWEITVDSRSGIQHEHKEVLYVHQIARRPSHRGAQIGSALEGALFAEAKQRGYTSVIAEILEDPIQNQISLEFHQRFGYKKIGTVREGEEMIWGLWQKNLMSSTE